MLCIECLKVKKKHPGRSARELSPIGSFEAITQVNGTAYCETHALMATKPLTPKQRSYYNNPPTNKSLTVDKENI